MIKDDKICPKAVTSQEEMLAMIREVNHDFLELQEQKELLKKKVESLRERLAVPTPFQPLGSRSVQSYALPLYEGAVWNWDL